MISVITASQVQVVSPVCDKHAARIEMIRLAARRTLKRVVAPVTVEVAPVETKDETARLNAEARHASLHKSFLAVWESHNA